MRRKRNKFNEKKKLRFDSQEIKHEKTNEKKTNNDVKFSIILYYISHKVDMFN